MLMGVAPGGAPALPYCSQHSVEPNGVVSTPEVILEVKNMYVTYCLLLRSYPLGFGRAVAAMASDALASAHASPPGVEPSQSDLDSNLKAFLAADVDDFWDDVRALN